MTRTYFAVIFLALSLAGCAGLESRRDGRAPIGGPGEAIEIKALKLTGRLAVKQGKEGQSGGMQWVHSPPNHEITVYTPIGTTVAKIEQNAQGAKLTTSNKEVYEAKDADQLMEQVMGWRLPLNGLQYWVLGRPVPDSLAEEERGENNRLVHLKQQNWDIQYSDFHALANVEMPYRIVMKRDDVTIRFFIDKIVPLLSTP